ncbi:MAG: hypothetical protein JW953_21830 [Anaerolineae bacterium]|nr:hypothetical protein [Anaerolineae bacterium]
MIAFFKSLTKLQILAIMLVMIGVVLVVYFGMRSYRSFRAMQYIQEQGLDLGTADVEAIRPWMTLRFIAVAYAVPQEYLFAELGIPFEQRNSNETLGQLNRKYDFGRPTEDHNPPILEKVKTAILKYQANPVATGLKEDIRPWMSVRYIANSTGIPAEYIFEQLNIPAEGNEGKPLDRLDQEYHYGGRRAIAEAVKQALAQYGGEQ